MSYCCLINLTKCWLFSLDIILSWIVWVGFSWMFEFSWKQVFLGDWGWGSISDGRSGLFSCYLYPNVTTYWELVFKPEMNCTLKVPTQYRTSDWTTMRLTGPSVLVPWLTRPSSVGDSSIGLIWLVSAAPDAGATPSWCFRLSRIWNIKQIILEKILDQKGIFTSSFSCILIK